MRFATCLPALFVAAVAATACGDHAARQAASAAAAAEYSPYRDSIRARGAARFAARPDTLLARADSARTLGAAAAPLWVILVGQLQCAACADAVHELLPVLRREYVDGGRIHLAYVNARAPDTDYNARFAAHAAYCGSLGGSFWKILDTIAATRDEWATLPDPQPYLDAIAVRLGADKSLQATCTERTLMLPLVMWDQERADAAGVTSLPTLLIGTDALSGDLSPTRVRRAIDEALAKKK